MRDEQHRPVTPAAKKQQRHERAAERVEGVHAVPISRIIILVAIIGAMNEDIQFPKRSFGPTRCGLDGWYARDVADDLCEHSRRWALG